MSNHLEVTAYIFCIGMAAVIFFGQAEPTTPSLLEASSKLIGYTAAMTVITISLICIKQKVITYATGRGQNV